MNFRFAFFAIVLLIIACGLYIVLPRYSQTNKQERKDSVIKIGAIVFLTGNQSTLGSEVNNAFNIAMEDINKKGGLNGKKVQLIVEDSKDLPKDGIMAFNKLVMDKIPIIITTGDVVSLSIAPIANKDSVILLTTIAAGSEITQNGEWVYRVWIQAERQAKAIADYTFQNLKIKKSAILFINNDYGITSSNIFKRIFTQFGGTITGMDSYSIEQKDIKNQIIKLIQNKPEAIFVTGFGMGYANCIRQLRSMNYKGLIVTDNTFSIPFFQEQTKSANEGIYFTSTLFDENSMDSISYNFSKKYFENYNMKPSFVGAFAYDALNLAIHCIEQGEYNNIKMKYVLNNLNNYKGLIGNIKFNKTGEIDFPLVIKKMEKGIVRIVSDNAY